MMKSSILTAFCLLFAITSSAISQVTIGSGGDPDEANLSGINGMAWIRSDDPSRRAGGETLFIGGTNGTNDFRAYVSFDLTNVTGTATGATLSLWSQGFDAFNASGGDQDLGMTPLNVVAMSDTITGFGDGAGNDAVIDGSGLPADFPNASPLYGAVVGTADFDIDNIAAGTQMDITFSDLSVIQSALGGTLTVGLQAPGAQSSGNRNFFAISGVVENGGTSVDDTPPSLMIDGVMIPEPNSLMLLVVCGISVLGFRRR